MKKLLSIRKQQGYEYFKRYSEDLKLQYGPVDQQNQGVLDFPAFFYDLSCQAKILLEQNKDRQKLSKDVEMIIKIDRLMMGIGSDAERIDMLNELNAFLLTKKEWLGCQSPRISVFIKIISESDSKKGENSALSLVCNHLVDNEDWDALSKVFTQLSLKQISINRYEYKKIEKHMVRYKECQKAKTGGFNSVLQAEMYTNGCWIPVALRLLKEEAHLNSEYKGYEIQQLLSQQDNKGVIAKCFASVRVKDEWFGEVHKTSLVGILEWLNGEELFEYEGKLGREQLKGVFLDCLNVLSLHQKQGISNNDFKTENMIMDPNGNVKIIDFGLAGPKKNNEGGTFEYEAEILSQKNYEDLTDEEKRHCDNVAMAISFSYLIGLNPRVYQKKFYDSFLPTRINCFMKEKKNTDEEKQVFDRLQPFQHIIIRLLEDQGKTKNLAEELLKDPIFQEASDLKRKRVSIQKEMVVSI